MVSRVDPMKKKIHKKDRVTQSSYSYRCTGVHRYRWCSTVPVHTVDSDEWGGTIFKKIKKARKVLQKNYKKIKGMLRGFVKDVLSKMSLFYYFLFYRTRPRFALHVASPLPLVTTRLLISFSWQWTYIQLPSGVAFGAWFTNMEQKAFTAVVSAEQK